MKYVLNGKRFTSAEPKTEVGEFYDNKLVKFDTSNIHDLACCWKHVIEINADYTDAWNVPFTASLLIKVVREICFQSNKQYFSLHRVHNTA